MRMRREADLIRKQRRTHLLGQKEGFAIQLRAFVASAYTTGKSGSVTRTSPPAALPMRASLVYSNDLK